LACRHISQKTSPSVSGTRQNSLPMTVHRSLHYGEWSTVCVGSTEDNSPVQEARVSPGCRQACRMTTRWQHCSTERAALASASWVNPWPKKKALSSQEDPSLSGPLHPHSEDCSDEYGGDSRGVQDNTVHMTLSANSTKPQWNLQSILHVETGTLNPPFPQWQSPGLLSYLCTLSRIRNGQGGSGCGGLGRSPVPVPGYGPR
jgi:hypothetical protein